MRLFGHRFAISPLFWVIWILGCATYLFKTFNDLLQKDFWILAGVLLALIVISMLWHEIGHTIFHRIFGGRKLDTVFGAYGGRTNSDAQLSRSRKVIVHIAGPVFSLALAVAVLIIQLVQRPEEGTINHESLELAKQFNLMWAIANLIPILPLDGGKLMVGFYPGTRIFLLIFGIIIAILATAFFWLSGRWAGAYLAAVIGYENIKLLFSRKKTL